MKRDMITSLLRDFLSNVVNSTVFLAIFGGFFTALSIGPSYIFLFKAYIMEESEEGIPTRVSTTAGLLPGQLILFISIYYPPLHLALGRPHTITLVVGPYLFFYVMTHFFDYPRKS